MLENLRKDLWIVDFVKKFVCQVVSFKSIIFRYCCTQSYPLKSFLNIRLSYMLVFVWIGAVLNCIMSEETLVCVNNSPALNISQVQFALSFWKKQIVIFFRPIFS